MNVVKRASTEAVWLGLRHSCTVGIWFWVSGETVCYQNWAPGNSTSEEHCEPTVRSGAVQSGGNQRWISRPETDKLNFICRRNLGFCLWFVLFPDKLILITEKLMWSEATAHTLSTDACQTGNAIRNKCSLLFVSPHHQDSFS
ncbi:hypothetical protein Q8A67_001678 [Cirrhinus molitorella]|uniref:C-type lectin domain-containing protein n=1 Tax=Cirrhinus molitorella TaxID=172907 RepID=A0AA88QIV4_9TELE|nr:hypothetical protein Q8A67_001678 [Cirrhinus molitorella]